MVSLVLLIHITRPLRTTWRAEEYTAEPEPPPPSPNLVVESRMGTKVSEDDLRSGKNGNIGQIKP